MASHRGDPPHVLTMLIAALWMLLTAAAPAMAQDQDIALPYRVGQGGLGDGTDVTSSGLYSATVPLALPSPRGDLGLPFAVTYSGGNLVGAVGLGWDIPIMTVRRSVTLAQRKPVHPPAGAPVAAEAAPAERLFLDLGSGPMLMARTGPMLWRPMVAAQYLELERTEAGWTALDMSGRRYEFSQPRSVSEPAGIPNLAENLDDDTLWVLSRVVDQTGANEVRLHYDVFDMPAPAPNEIDGDQTSRELVLRSLTHSPDASGRCFKYEIALDYRPVRPHAPHPRFLALWSEGGRMRTRTRILDRISTWVQTDPDCVPSGRALLNTYRFDYAPDRDTSQPRLASVDLYGRDDDATDPSTAHPVRRYAYGSALQEDVLVYGATRNVPLDLGPSASLFEGFASTFLTGSFFVGPQKLIDLNGDARIDAVSYAEPDQFLLRTNVASSDGQGTSTFPDVTSHTWPGELVTTGSPGISTALANPAPTFTSVWRQYIDWNGDGRTDIVDALNGEDADHWAVNLNLPGASGAPGDIEWRLINVDISHLRDLIGQFHNLDSGLPAFPARHLPLSRSHATYERDGAETIRSGRVTEWSIADANADGFPDFLYNQMGSLAQTATRCDPSGACREVQVFDVFPTNALRVIYHTGPKMAGAGVLDAAWRGPSHVQRTDGRCGLARFVWVAGDVQHMACGALEFNGDGIADYLIETDAENAISSPAARRLVIQSSGLPEDIDAALPENTAAWPFVELGRAVAVPGPVNAIETERRDSCPRDAASGALRVPGDTRFETRQISALRDLTGDGIADYVWFGTPSALASGPAIEFSGAVPPASGAEIAGDAAQGWWVMVGTGRGFVQPRPIRASPDAPFEIHVSRERCDGQASHIRHDLLDIDGDGRLDLVQSVDGGLRISSLIDAGGRRGAHGAGKLVAERNGHGAATLIRYGSAKAGPATGSLLPFPQLVVTEVQRVVEWGPGASMAPTRYAYGDARLHYDALLGRWVSGGYGRRVVLEGLPTDATRLRLRGTATVVDLRHAETLPAGLERRALTGSLRRISHLAGDFTSDPRDLLNIEVGTDFRVRGQRHVQHGVTQSLAPPTDPVAECGDLAAYGSASAPDALLCRRTALLYTAETRDWHGHAPWPSKQSVATRSYVRAETVDAFGRPGTVVLENDRARSDDDVCLHTTFAEPRSGPVRVLDAIHIQRVSDCRDDRNVLGGRRTLYDGLPEGAVSAGLVTGRIVERYDVAAGTLIETYRLDRMRHDVFGNVTEIEKERGDGVSATQRFGFGPFGLKPEVATLTASDVPVALSQTFSYDPVTILPVSVIDESGLELRARYDGLGRLTASSVFLPGDPTEYLQATRAYLGDRNADPDGRGLRERFFRSWTPLAEGLTAPIASTPDSSVVETRFDAFGRPRFIQTDLGADFGGAVLVEGAMEYDRLGRTRFAAAPFLEGTSPAARYGTTLHYTAEGHLSCAILGTGPQTADAVSDPEAERFAQCHEYDFAEHRALIRTRGPEALTPGAPQEGSHAQTALTAIGRTVALSRWQGQERLELAEFEYDRLSALSRIRRYAEPVSRSGQAVWRIESDSLGQMLRVAEPAAAERRFVHDRWGHLIRMEWTEGGNSPPQDRAVANRFDGFGRLTQADEFLGGMSIPERRVRYRYDTATDAAAHAGAEHLTGRLSFAEDATTRTYFGYDAMGRRTVDTRVHRADGRTISTLTEQGPLGDLQRLTFRDEEQARSEHIDYGYDSAGHLTRITHVAEGGARDLWLATEVDPFGRYVSVLHGNGVITRQDYDTDGRRALREMAVLTAADAEGWRLRFHGFDGRLRVLGETMSFAGVETSNDYEYDALHRLSRAHTTGPGNAVRDRRFAYDGLGNLVSVSGPPGTGTLSFLTDQADPDRLCAVQAPGPQAPSLPEAPDFPFHAIAALPERAQGNAYAAGATEIREPTADRVRGGPAETVASALCGYIYDAMGNVRQVGLGQPAMHLAHDAQNRLLSIAEGTVRLKQRHDPFGALATRDVQGVGPGVDRAERRFGPLVEEVTFHDGAGQPAGLGGPNGPRRLTDFRVPWGAGMVAHLRRLDGGELVTLYPHDDLTAPRLVSDPQGAVTHSQRYGPYGWEIGPEPDPAQAARRIAKAWNGGDPMAPFDLVQLGARLYDPGTGRFLERDPLLVPRGASRSHPYAFGWNDPVNNTDPLGLDPGCIGLECRGFGGGWGGFDFGGADSGGLDWGPDIAWVQVSGPNDDGVSANVARHSEWFDMARRYPCLACHSIRQLNRLPRNEEWDEGDLLALWSRNATVAGRLLMSSTSLLGAVADVAVGYFVFDEEISAQSLLGLTPVRGVQSLAGLRGATRFQYATYWRSGLRYRSSVGSGARLESVVARVGPSHLGRGGRTTAASVRFARRLGRSGDDAGHGVAYGLGGPGGARSRNIFSQDLRFNRGPVRVFEQFVASEVRAGATVYVRVVPQYLGNQTRPFRILYQARINGRTISRVFDNTGLWVLR